MVYEGGIKGKYVALKPADEADSAFTLSLRQDPQFTAFLPRLDITLEQQKAWIAAQREREDDYFFVVWTNEGVPIGTVSVYNVNGDTSESGRLALRGNALQNTEACLLLFRFAFDVLHLKEVTGYIVDGNRRAERFNSQFGCITGQSEADADGQMIRRTQITAEAFHTAAGALEKKLYRNVQ